MEHRGRCITVAPHAAHPGILVTRECAPTAVAKLSLCYKVSRKKGGGHGETLARAREACRGGSTRRIVRGPQREKGEVAESARTFKFMVMLDHSARGYRSRLSRLLLPPLLISLLVIVIFVYSRVGVADRDRARFRGDRRSQGSGTEGSS